MLGAIVVSSGLAGNLLPEILMPETDHGPAWVADLLPEAIELLAAGVVLFPEEVE